MPSGLPGKPSARVISFSPTLPPAPKHESEVTEVETIVRVPVPISTTLKAGRTDPIDHGPVAQDRQIEARPVEGDHLGPELSNPIDEGLDHLRLGPLGNMRRSERQDGPNTFAAFGDQSADASDLVERQLRELIP